MSHNDDCNIILYRIDWNGPSRNHATRKTDLFPPHNALRRELGPENSNTFLESMSHCHHYNTRFIDEYLFYACLGLPSDVER